MGAPRRSTPRPTAPAGAVWCRVVPALSRVGFPPHLHLQHPSPHIPGTDIPISVPTERRPWPELDGRRIAGLSSFGISGINAHRVIEAAPEPAPSSEAAAPVAERPLHLLCLSPRTE